MDKSNEWVNVSPKGDRGKQCVPRSDAAAAECRIWSCSRLFILNTRIFVTIMRIKQTRHPLNDKCTGPVGKDRKVHLANMAWVNITVIGKYWDLGCVLIYMALWKT